MQLNKKKWKFILLASILLGLLSAIYLVYRFKIGDAESIRSTAFRELVRNTGKMQGEIVLPVGQKDFPAEFKAAAGPFAEEINHYNGSKMRFYRYDDANGCFFVVFDPADSKVIAFGKFLKSTSH